jgi:hypothetical protein
VDSRQARAILACYRPGLDDPQGEPFAQALEQARRDPELARWLESEMAFDAAIGGRLREAPVPPDLLSRILAGHPVAAPVVWWRQRLVAFASLALALIAAIMIVALEQRASSSDFASYRGQMGALVAGDYKLDIETRELAVIQEFFARRHWPADYSVPAGLQGYPLEGAMAVEWHGHRISLICFGAEDDESKDLWLFVADHDTVPDAPSSTVPEFAPAGKLVTASWSSVGRVYLLAGRGDEQSLRGFLPDHGPAQSSSLRFHGRPPEGARAAEKTLAAPRFPMVDGFVDLSAGRRDFYAHSQRFPYTFHLVEERVGLLREAASRLDPHPVQGSNQP